MKTIHAAATAFVVLAASACASMPIRTDNDEQASSTAAAQTAFVEKSAKGARSAHVIDHERVIGSLNQLLRSRGIGNPLVVVDSRVISAPLPQYVRQYDIECVELRPGRIATLEYRRGFQDATTDGVLLIWTRGSRGRKPRNCKIPY